MRTDRQKLEGEGIKASQVILRAEVGSTVWGLNISDSGDKDEMGIVVEGLEKMVGFQEYEQTIYRTATERTGEHDAPSQSGDLDLTIYSLRKWLRLALKGNPTILTLLFVPMTKWVSGDSRGLKLQELAHQIVSKKAGGAFLGYLQAQRMRLTGEKGGRHGVFDLSKGEYDGKYAMHMLRLGYQGVELLRTGKMVVPLSDPTRGYLLDVRNGKDSLQGVLTKCGELERELKDLLDSSPLPEAPNMKMVEEWMMETYYQSWQSTFGHELNMKYRGMIKV